MFASPSLTLPASGEGMLLLSLRQYLWKTEMLLAIDAGNTNIVFALFEGATMRGVWRAATNTQRTSDE